MELAVWRPQLEDILVQDGDRSLAAITIPLLQELWPVVQQAGDVADVCKAALVFSLKETAVEGEDGMPHAKWELVRLASNPAYDPEMDDPDEKLLPHSGTWQEFCLVHLQMNKSTASKYKRIWQVYHEKLGYGLEDLLGAGVFKLGAAVSLLDKMISSDKGVDSRLIVALFGTPHVCAACDGYVPFETSPQACPHCGEDYQGVQPLSGPQTLLLLQQIRQEMQGDVGEEEYIDFLGSVELRYDDDGEVIELAFLADYRAGEQKVVLPEWVIPVVDDDAPERDFGLRRSHLAVFRQWLGKKFPGA